MKKIIITILALSMIFTLCACGKAPVAMEMETPAPTATLAPEPTSTQNPYYMSVSEIDEKFQAVLGDWFVQSEFDNGMYIACITYDGAALSCLMETDEWKELCDSLDDLCETCYEKVGREFSIVLMIVNDNDNDKVLYVTYNGTDVTDIL